MFSPLPLEAYAQDLLRDRLRQAAQDALAAQLPPAALGASPLSRLDLATRSRVARGLLALASRLDPCSALDRPAALSLSQR
jgi:hypothetical protein